MFISRQKRKYHRRRANAENRVDADHMVSEGPIRVNVVIFVLINDGSVYMDVVFSVRNDSISERRRQPPPVTISQCSLSSAHSH